MKHKFYKRRPHEGFYIYSSSGCGDNLAIRLAHVEDCEKTVCVAMSADEAIELANLLYDVANDYKKGVETGMEPRD